MAPATRTTPIVCTINGAATTISNPPKINENVPNIPPNLVDFRNRLTVNSTLNGASVTGVSINQVGGAPLGLGGATNYTVSPEQSINAILQAPASFSGGSFSSWTGCNVDASLVDPKQCRIIMNESPTGGSSRTIVANYTASSPPSTPILSAVHSSTCGSGQIDLSWNNVANETGYVLEYSTNSSSGPWSNLINLGADVTSYPHTGLSAGTLYYYRIRATSSAGNSGNGAAQENAPYNCLALTCTRSAASSPTPAIGENVTWTANPSGGNGSYTYSWAGTDPILPAPTVNPHTRSYSTFGFKRPVVTVTSGDGQTMASGGFGACLGVTVSPVLTVASLFSREYRVATLFDSPDSIISPSLSKIAREQKRLTASMS
jgi:hypothetical protein